MLDATYRNGQSVSVSSSEGRVRRVTLFNTRGLDVRVGRSDAGAVVDHASGQQVGTAQRRAWRRGFWLRDADERLVVRVVRRWLSFSWTWKVFGADGEQLGSINGIFQQNRQGELVRSTGDPWSWKGVVLIYGEEVAFIEAGAVVEPGTRRLLAELTLSHPEVMSPVERSTVATWRLRIADRVEGALRVMVLAWVGVAFDVQRDREGFDPG